MKIKKTYFLIVLFLCGLSVGNLCASASAAAAAEEAAAPVAGYLGAELRSAAIDGEKATIEELIAAGADVNAVDHGGSTALMWAVEEGYENIVELLLDAGAHVNVANRGKDTALIWATQRNHENIVKKLLQVDGIDVNVADQYGYTPLMSAAFNGHTDMVKKLLEAGADKEIQDMNGQTAADLARNDDLANMIRDYGSVRHIKFAGKR